MSTTLPPVPLQAPIADSNTGIIPPGWAAYFRSLSTSGSGSGVTIHAELQGLSADDHLQYLTNTRGDARYYSKTYVDTQLAGKEASLGNPATSGFVLASSTAGVRSWVAVNSNLDGGTPSSVYGGTTGIE